MNLQGLRDLLALHRPADALEQEHLRRMEALLEVDQPCSRHTFEPGHFTASSFVLSPEGDAILLILHSKLNLWLQPGGHIDDADADVLAAALREAEEETGMVGLEPLPGLLDVDIHPIPPNPRKNEPAHEHFDVRFLFQAASRDFAAASDALAGRWVRLEDVVDAGTDESVERAVRKLQARPSTTRA